MKLFSASCSSCALLFATPFFLLVLMSCSRDSFGSANFISTSKGATKSQGGDAAPSNLEDQNAAQASQSENSEIGAVLKSTNPPSVDGDSSVADALLFSNGKNASTLLAGDSCKYNAVKLKEIDCRNVGSDTLSGGGGEDVILAAGNDDANGDDDCDFLLARCGRVQLKGGAAGDLFVLADCSIASFATEILDFEPQLDLIQLSFPRIRTADDVKVIQMGKDVLFQLRSDAQTILKIRNIQKEAIRFGSIFILPDAVDCNQ